MLAICLGLSAWQGVLQESLYINLVTFRFVNLKSSHTIGIYDDVVLTFVTETTTTAVNQEHNFRQLVKYSSLN